MAANTVYEFHGVVTSQYGLRFASGTTIKGSSLGSGAFYYVGTGAALRSSGITSHVICSYLSVFAPNGSAMLFSGNINYQLMLFFCGFFNCKAIGTISGFDVASIKSCIFSNTSNDFVNESGLVYDGTMNKILLGGNVFQKFNTTSHVIEFSDSLTVSLIDIEGNYFKYDSSFAAMVDSGCSITTAAIFRGNAFAGTVQACEGFGPETVIWDFVANTGVKDSQIVGLTHLTASSSTTFVSTGVAVKVAGTTSTEMNERFTGSNNRLTYTGVRDDLVSVDASFTVDAAGNNKQISVYIAKKGTIRAASRSMVRVASGADNRSGVCLDLLNLQTGDYIEVWAANDTDTTSITVLEMTLRVIG